MRSTQPERYSRKQHDLSVQIQRLKRPLMEIPAAQTSPKSDRFSSEAFLGILSSFPRKAMNTKVGDNFVARNLDTEFALFRVRT